MTPRQFLEWAASAQTDECITWPFAKDDRGYGRVAVGRKNRRAHRVVMELVHGPQPARRFVRHGPCHNTSCINPKHLTWGGHRDNMTDMLRDDTWGKKLRKADVVMIRQLRDGGLTQQAIADHFGISRQHVGNILTGHRWGELS